ncbi:hypothetical protein KSP39_PZI020136 [Platanthera zijinensis]|uniref:CCHC-type domain-containing protein n=1 Tax=Platanthera zijinensis TaxID=2320716 RepID=A0AAP0FX08_9ASPA
MRTRLGTEYSAPSMSRMAENEHEIRNAEAIAGLRNDMTELRGTLAQILQNQVRPPPPPANVELPHRRQHISDSDSDGDSPRVPPRGNRHGREFDITRAIKIDAPTFDGMGDPQNFLTWIVDMECYYDWHHLTDPQKVQVARMKLTGRAKTYWLNEERRLGTGDGDPIFGWTVMKNLLTDQYVPTYHRTQMFDELASLRQGSNSVSEYMGELKDRLVRCNLREIPEVTLSRFRKGLQPDIQRKLLRYGHTDLNTTFNADLDIEKHLASKAHSRYSHAKGKSSTGASSSTYQDKGKYRSAESKSVVITARNTKNPASERIPIGKVSKTNATCYSCGIQGHYAFECPTKTKAIALLESTTDLVDYVYEAAEESDPEGVPSDLEDDHPLMVMRCILATPRPLDEWKRTSIFSLIFKSGEKLCKLIVDSGRCVNVVSENAIARMSLTTEPHPTPYKVAWINKISVPVTKRCLVPLIQILR